MRAAGHMAILAMMSGCDGAHRLPDGRDRFIAE
jgi:hypothetical protein